MWRIDQLQAKLQSWADSLLGTHTTDATRNGGGAKETRTNNKWEGDHTSAPTAHPQPALTSQSTAFASCQTAKRDSQAAITENRNVGEAPAVVSKRRRVLNGEPQDDNTEVRTNVIPPVDRSKLAMSKNSFVSGSGKSSGKDLRINTEQDPATNEGEAMPDEQVSPKRWIVNGRPQTASASDCLVEQCKGTSGASKRTLEGSSHSDCQPSAKRQIRTQRLGLSKGASTVAAAIGHDLDRNPGNESCPFVIDSDSDPGVGCSLTETERAMQDTELDENREDTLKGVTFDKDHVKSVHEGNARAGSSHVVLDSDSASWLESDTAVHLSSFLRSRTGADEVRCPMSNAQEDMSDEAVINGDREESEEESTAAVLTEKQSSKDDRMLVESSLSGFGKQQESDTAVHLFFSALRSRAESDEPRCPMSHPQVDHSDEALSEGYGSDGEESGSESEESWELGAAQASRDDSTFVGSSAFAPGRQLAGKGAAAKCRRSGIGPGNASAVVKVSKPLVKQEPDVSVNERELSKVLTRACTEKDLADIGRKCKEKHPVFAHLDVPQHDQGGGEDSFAEALLTCRPEGPGTTVGDALRWILNNVKVISKQGLIKAATEPRVKKFLKNLQVRPKKQRDSIEASMKEVTDLYHLPPEAQLHGLQEEEPEDREVEDLVEPAKLLDSSSDESVLDQTRDPEPMEPEEDHFDDTDSDVSVKSEPISRGSSPEPSEEFDAGMDERLAPNPGLPDSIEYKYVDGEAAPRTRKELPMVWRDAWANVWASASSACYQTFMSEFFRGAKEGYENHDWTSELLRCSAPPSQQPQHTVNRNEDRPKLSVWQAAGYQHARCALESTKTKGCVFWWTPGSGKSVMVALLIELLLDKPMEIFVVSTPQNIRENGYDECAKSLLKFSPVYCAHKAHVSRAQVEEFQEERFRKRKPKFLKKSFLSLRQFQNEMTKRQDLKNIAVIIDECHELFNSRLCDQDAMWRKDDGVITRLAEGDKNKLFLLSGTPWRDKGEMERLLGLVICSYGHSPPSRMIDSDEGEIAELRARFRGCTSFVDGAKDRHHFPDDGGWKIERCIMHQDQLYNFCRRSQHLLGTLAKRSDAAPLNFCQLVSKLRSNDVKVRKEAIRVCRLTQVAGGVQWGGGLRQVMDSLTLDEVARFAPKFKVLCQNLLDPRGDQAGFLNPLQMKHFCYSGSQSTITHLAATLCALRPRRFKQLTACDLEWADERKDEVRLRNPIDEADKQSLFFVNIRGSQEEKKKLKAAFGFVTPANHRFEGLRRSDGQPLVQVLLGSHETNQGLTFLRLQRIHLLEPNPLGWSKIVQSIGRGIRRDTHKELACDGTVAAAEMRTVRTIIYTTLADKNVLKKLKQEHKQDIEDDLAEIRQQFQKRVDALTQLRFMLATAADPSLEYKAFCENQAGKLTLPFNDLADRVRKLEEENQKRKQGWLRVPIAGTWSKRKQAVRKKLVQTWEVMPDEAVYQATWDEHVNRQKYDTAIKGLSVDASLLSDFHQNRTAQEAPTAFAVAIEAGRRQYVSPTDQSRLAMLEQFPAELQCTLCLSFASAGRKCVELHVICENCVKMSSALGSGIVPCSMSTCGFLGQASLLRKFPPYWSQADRDGFHLVKNPFMEDRIWTLIEKSLLSDCKKSESPCNFGRIEEWGRISKVLRIENGQLFQRYSSQKLIMIEKTAKQSVEKITARTRPWRDIFKDVTLNEDLNEFFLFHGTRAEHALAIAKNGFDMTAANPQGLYGAGIYFADAACKSMRYCEKGAKKKILLLCRVLMGAAHKIQGHCSGQTQPPDGYDSVFAEKVKSQTRVVHHNEYVVYDDTQIYPEYLVEIDWKQGGDDVVGAQTQIAMTGTEAQTNMCLGSV